MGPQKIAQGTLLFRLGYVKILSKGKHRENRYAIGDFHLSSDDYYYEVKVIGMHERERSVVSVGLWSGTTNASYAYYSNGTILGHNFYGSTGFPKFGHGYIIGCGLNLTTMIAIYTINGRLLYPIWSNVGTNENGRRFCKEIVTEAKLFFKNFIRLQKNFINLSKSALKFSRAENEQRKDLTNIE
ncbi:hypothetical protein niasHS_016817 [Heterodera schachtii]|uniref:B30.2/SPRY domain-containing protein n=1 Tax=Heterodera schachtii TaxID=97005 RepID=A0ABD2HP97_HETSC